MLDRILAKSRSPLSCTDRSYGTRHSRAGRHAGLTRIAEMIRQDIVLARTVFSSNAAAGDLAIEDLVGNAPAEILFDVDTRFGSEIVITLSSVPQEWGWVHEYGVATVSPALRALADELATVMNSYNHDGSDVDKRFFGKVRVGNDTLAW